MGLKFQQTDRVRSRAEILLDAPKNKHKKLRMMRANAFRSLVSSLFMMGGLIFVVYCSSLYFGAFVDVGEIVGTSQQVRASKIKASVGQIPRVKQRTLISPITKHLTTDRFYMRRGQSVLVTYSLPKNSKLSLIIQQCKTIPILEIFKCTPVGEQSRSINNKTTGFVEFTASRPGFYHFQKRVVQSPNMVLVANIDYQVVWQRGGKRPQ